MANVIEVIIKASDQFTAEFRKAGQAGKKFETDLGANFTKTIAVMGTVSAAMGLLIRKVVNDASQYGESLAEMSEKTGMTTETLAGLGYGAKLLGMDLESLQVGFKTMSGLAYDASTGSDEAGKKFGALGVSVTDSAGNLKDMDTLLAEVSDGLAKIENPTQRAAMATDFFGRAGLQLLPILGKGSAELERYKARAKELGVSLSGEDAKAMDAYRDSLDDLNTGIMGIKIAVTQALLPALKGLVTWAINVSKEIRVWAKEHPALTEAIGKTAIAIMGSAGLLAALGFVIKIAPEVAAAVYLMTGPFGQIAFIIAAAASLVKDWLPGMAEGYEDAALAAEHLNRALEAQKRYWAKPAGAGGGAGGAGGAGKTGAVSVGGIMPQTVRGRSGIREVGAGPTTEPSRTAEDLNNELRGSVDLWTEIGIAATAAGQEIEATWRPLIAETLMQGIDQISGRFGNAMAQMLVYGKSFAKSFSGAFKEMAAMIVSELAKIIAKLIAIKLLKMALGIPFAEGGIVPQYAQFGALIHGPAGIDRVPIWATAGEEVNSLPTVALVKRLSKMIDRGALGGGGVTNVTNNFSAFDSYSFREWIRFGDGGRQLRAAGLIP